ncbi:hypothetical protein LJC40_05880 [Synergistaceae bacterium OttesenSCG-928-D05]|nr:hypothetical protein [Synergistaceae bacterium OttesenSCG-928-D05]
MTEHFDSSANRGFREDMIREGFDAAGFDSLKSGRAGKPAVDDPVGYVIAKIYAETGENVLKEYLPIVLKHTWRCVKEYEGKVLFTDLFQAGCLAVVQIAAVSKDSGWRARQMKQRVPQEIWRAARKYLSLESVELEKIEETIPEYESSDRRKHVEMKDMIRQLLTDEEYDLTLSLIDGEGQAAYAKRRGISQATVSRRLERVREKLRPVFLRDPEKNAG